MAEKKEILINNLKKSSNMQKEHISINTKESITKELKNKEKKIINQKKNKKWKKYTILVCILVIFLLLLGISSAFFNYTRNGQLSELVVGKIYMHYNTNSVSLQNVEPRDSYDPNTYIAFTVDGLNEYTKSDIWYAIDLLYGDIPTGRTEDNRIRDDLLRFRLTKSINNGSEEVVIDNVGYVSINNLRMYVESIPAESENEIVHSYKLYVWISDEIKVGNTQYCDYTISEWNDLFASVKIKVIGDFLPKGSSNSVRVNFDANGGTVSIPYRYYDVGSTYDDLPIPEREDYTFDGWYYNNTLISSTDTVTREEDIMNLHAEWTEIPGVAKIDNTYYLTLADAIGAVPTNNTEKTIIIIKDTSACVTVAKNKNMILNMRGHTIQSSCNNTIVENSGTITILNGTFDGGTITNAVVNNKSGAKITVGNGGRIVATGTRGGIFNTGGNVEILEGAYLSSAPTGTANGRKLPRATVNSYGGGSVVITGGTIIGVNQEAVAVENSILTIGVKDGNISRTSPVIQGGTNGVSVLDSTTFSFYDGIIKGKNSGLNDPTLIDAIEVGCGLVTSSETIGGQSYITHHLGFGITITFDPKEGNIDPSDATRTIESGNQVGALPRVTRAGWKFIGWFTERDSGVQITSETTVLKTTTFYAHWEEVIAAEINGVEYNTVQAALDDIPTDNTPVMVTITDDLTENITIKPNQNVILDIQDNTMDNDGDTAVITNNGTVEIVSGTVSTEAATNAAINNNANGVIIINGGRIEATATRSAIYNNGGRVEIRGNSYISSTASGKPTATTLDRGTIHNFNNGTVIITGGTIVGVNQQAISNETATIIIGQKDGNISALAPIIIGKNYGIVNTGTFKFYDGIIKGRTGAISGSITEREANSAIANGTETIDGFNYNTQYLQPSP